MNIIAVALIASTVLAGETQRSIEHLPQCRGANVSAPNGWKSIDLADNNARFQIPADMQPSNDSKVFCVHGCEQWIRGTFQISVLHGIWGPSSFDDQAWAKACVVKHGALRVVQMPSKNDNNQVIVAWPVNDTSTQSTQDILLNIQWSEAADEADAKAVIASLR